MAAMDGAQPWQLYVKDMVGATTTVSVPNPEVSCDCTSARASSDMCISRLCFIHAHIELRPCPSARI